MTTNEDYINKLLDQVMDMNLPSNMVKWKPPSVEDLRRRAYQRRLPLEFLTRDKDEYVYIIRGERNA